MPWVATATGVVLLILAPRYGPHRDELYFVVAGHHPQRGYPDQPPLTPLLAAFLHDLAPGSLVALRSVLADNGIVCLLGERDLRRTGIPVTFFGEPTRMPAGPARLAMETGAALLVAEFWYENDCEMRVRIHPPIEVTDDPVAATQAMADRFAEAIARHPADWHMLQPLWLDDLSEQRRRSLED